MEKTIERGDLCIYVTPLNREAIIFMIHLCALHLRMKGFLYAILKIFVCREFPIPKKKKK
ncbi:hypothetical protein HanIR_Chr06g0298001 [Helianthus annuus]|nr:hypothetical protein HanIR_Chr06g0298001 [Helianthus annuus]